MKIIFFTISFVTLLFSNILDHYFIIEAHKQYEDKDYHEALLYSNKIEDKDDSIYYNIGNIYYRLKKYEKALMSYRYISDAKLNFEKQYNMANCYAMLNRYNDAIIYYRSALRFKDDTDTKENLNIVLAKQKDLKEKEKHKELIDRDNKLFSFMDRLGSSMMDKDSNKGKNRFNNSKSDKKVIAIKKDNITNNITKHINNKIKNQIDLKEDIKISKEQQTTLTTDQERKYSKLLKDKKIRTLLIPMFDKE